ncbi:MAG: hypothetical protein AAF570_00835 [Bacteroidota bacterium]
MKYHKIKVTVTNQTGVEMNDISFHHAAGEKKTDLKVKFLEADAHFQVEIETHAEESDYWSIRFGDGVWHWYRNKKRCSISKEDIFSHRGVHINLLPPKQGFSIEMPVSASCNDNYYDKGSGQHY